MDEPLIYEKYLRERITELCTQKDVLEHRMSLELGKSGSYIRSITSGMALPSVRELFNIISYFDMTPPEFFVGFDNKVSLRNQLREKLMSLSNEDSEKVAILLTGSKNSSASYSGFTAVLHI